MGVSVAQSMGFCSEFSQVCCDASRAGVPAVYSCRIAVWRCSISVRRCFCASVKNCSLGESSPRSASSVLLSTAKTLKYSSWDSGSYLWLWHWAQLNVEPIQTAIVVLTRSTTATLRNSSSCVPPSLLVMVLRWKAVAMS